MQKLFDFVLIFDLCKAQPLVDQRDVRRAALLANVNMRRRLAGHGEVIRHHNQGVHLPGFQPVAGGQSGFPTEQTVADDCLGGRNGLAGACRNFMRQTE